VKGGVWGVCIAENIGVKFEEIRGGFGERRANLKIF
jgi:hypothetical protein